MKNSFPKNRVLRGLSPTENSPVHNPPQRHVSSRRPRSENIPPPDPNVPHETGSRPSVSKIRSPLPPRPTSNTNPLKRKLSMEGGAENGCTGSSDSGVKVVVRMRPKKEDEGDLIVQKVSPNCVSILDHVFTFDSVADTDSTQHDIFELVGVPLVENCLDGFNSSIFAYGQTGSGKTYTMWGPQNSLAEDDSLSQDKKGLTPRVFELLFSRMKEEKMRHMDKQMNYHCQCSFLEIYNEQITDLLDPNRRNLQIREDVRTGVYVEDLTTECVCDMKDLMKILIKGLANRRIGATSINAESSRSHCVFTCIVESQWKNMADGLSIVRVSRINLVDLAGSERQKQTGAAGERLKEAGNINRSLSQLGNLINILAEVSHSGKQRHIPYRDSRLTFLLQESLGGNAKLAMICAISPAQSCKSETFSTLRFAQRAKAIKNTAIVNEETQEDMNSLREVIRQLRDELLQLKSSGCSPNGAGWNARRSLDILKRSLSRTPVTFPCIDEDGDEVMEIDEEAIEQLCVQAGLESSKKAGLESSKTHNPQSLTGETSLHGQQLHEDSCEDVNMEDCQDQNRSCGEPDKHVTSPSAFNNLGSVAGLEDDGQDKPPGCPQEEESPRHEPNPILPVLSIIPCELSPPMQSPPSIESPKSPSGCQRNLRSSRLSPSKSNKGSMSFVKCSMNLSRTQCLEVCLSRKSLKSSNLSASKSDPSKREESMPFIKRSMSLSPTQCLEASLSRGLQIIDEQQQNGALRHSSFRFSCKPLDFRSIWSPRKVDVGVQTLSEDSDTIGEGSPAGFVCIYCGNREPLQEKHQECSEESHLPLVPVDRPQDAEKLKNQIPKAVEKVLAGAIRREMALEDRCTKLVAEIAQLNRLVQQYKHEREYNVIIEQMREDKIHRLEGLMDGILPAEEFMEEEFLSLINEHKLLKEKYDYHPEILRIKIEMKRIQDELDEYKNFFDMGERDVLMDEIQNLRNQLQNCLDSLPFSGRKQRTTLQLTYPNEIVSSSPTSEAREGPEEQFEKERGNWIEMESKWISLTEELRLELEDSRSLAEKQKCELEAEQKCSEELKEALQLAMQGHANILDQYADLQEKHIALLARHQKIRDGILDVKKAAARAGVRGAESRFIDSLAAEISALKVQMEKERRYLRDENRGLQAQLRDTADAVQAAGELLVRLKEAEEAVSSSEMRATGAEQEVASLRHEIEQLKRKHEMEIATRNQFLAESRLPMEALTNKDTGEGTGLGSGSFSDERWKEEFGPFFHSDGTSWFAGYDQCNV